MYDMHLYDMIFLLKLFYSFSGKPIRFGYKNWVLTSDDGYPYKIIPYQGKAMATDHGPFGPCVVNSLLEVVQNPACHEVFFDNFFTSVGLLKSLRAQGIKATGTIRVNRSNSTPLPPAKSMEKKARGTIEVCSTNDVCAVCWVDNKVVTLASNNLPYEPLQNCSRYCRQKKQKVTIPHNFL